MSEPTSQTRSKSSKDKEGNSPAYVPMVQHDDSHGHAPEEHGEGNWLVSYADMMTLLVGFFVILLSFSTMDPEKFDEARKSITAEFGGSYQVPYSELSDRVREAVKKLGVGDQLLLKISDAGLEISFKGTVFFDTGSADLKPEAKPILENLIAALKSEGTDLDITIEGHTDDVPIVSGKLFRNNWELSSLRACRVLDAFLSASIPMNRLTAVGYGEARPLVPNRDADGVALPENQSQNRRVVIRATRHAEPILVKVDKDGHAEAVPAATPASEGSAAPAMEAVPAAAPAEAAPPASSAEAPAH